ncbi:MAG: CoA transferase [Pseudomonadota bacterium]
MLPLTGIRVAEFTNILSGPYCGMLLSDLGANVIKIEKPTGDDMRYWPPVNDGYSENFASVNRNKRSIALNLKSETDLEVARDLCRTSHIVLENNRPGAMARLGLGYDDVKALNPAVIYCSISAFGTDGPDAKRGGFDLVVQAESGIMSVTGEDDPVKCGVPISDVATGLYAAFAISAALREVEKTGVGTFIDMSMLGASIGIAALQTSEFFGMGRNSPRMGSRHPRNAPYQAFKARDGLFVMAAGNDKLFHDVCRVVGRMDLTERPEYATTTLRAQNQAELAQTLEIEFAEKTAAEWVDVLGAAGLPCGLIHGYEDALAQPQVRHCGFVQPMTLPNGVETHTFGSAIRFNGESQPIRSRPPALDEHGEEIRAEVRNLA